MSHLGASTHASFITTPASAPNQTMPSTTVASVPCSTSRPNGVYVPAMSTKIIEWSSQRIQRRVAGRQVMRW